MAIDPKELRIGSHVNVNGLRVRVGGVYKESIVVYTPNDAECENHVIDLNRISSIPITPELLTELGFEWNGTSYSKEYAKDSYVVIFPYKTIESFRVILHPRDSRRHMDFLFEYLHELESLYYHCTKQELFNN